MPAASNTGWPTANPDETGDSGSFTGAAAELILGKLDTITEQTRPHKAKPRIPWDSCHPVWQTGQISLTGGAGTLAQPNLYGPELPYWWDLRSVRLWGFTAGTVTVYRNFTTAEILAQTTTVGEFTWSAQEFLAPQDSLVFGATGVTGTVNVSMWAIEVEAAWLPEYLM